METKRKGIIITLFIILFFLLGYFRNYVFLSINAQSAAVYYRVQGPALPDFLSFLSNKDYAQIIRIKWIFTLLFAMLFCGTALISLYMMFKKPLYIKLCLTFYAAISLFSLLCMLSGYVIPSFSVHAFNIARNLMHLVQSPFTIAFLMVVAYAHKRMAA